MCLVCLLLCKEEGSSPVSAITERMDMGLYEILVFVGFQHAREQCQSKRAYVF